MKKISKLFNLTQDEYLKLKETGMGNATLGLRMLILGRFPVVGLDLEIKKKSSKKSSTPSDSVKKEKKQEVISQKIRAAYEDSFFEKYKIKPIWSVKENVMANNLIRSAGIETAIKLASYYPRFKDDWHEKQKHPFSLLVSQLNRVLISYNIAYGVSEKLEKMKLVNCKECNNQGRIQKDSYLFRCKCEWGDQYPSFPKIGEENARNYDDQF